jgi:hypothetical protein
VTWLSFVPGTSALESSTLPLREQVIGPLVLSLVNAFSFVFQQKTGNLVPMFVHRQEEHMAVTITKSMTIYNLEWKSKVVYECKNVQRP